MDYEMELEVVIYLAAFSTKLELIKPSFYSSYLNFSFGIIIKVWMMQLYNGTNTATAWKNFIFILFKRSDFHIWLLTYQ